ncbi:MAG: PIN domain-containing protein [Vicinamibacteria bacterium]|nr:PIN domain-containing protein [Vicinamibacteria bacterium]
MTALVDTNVLVYRFDPRFPEKQERATRLLAGAVQSGSLSLPHQALVEFMAATTRPLKRTGPLLSPGEAREEIESMLLTFDILYPDASLVRTALRGAAAYGLSWFDAHLWAYAEHFGCRILYSEDFQHGRVYGSVRIVNPFLKKDAA